MPSKIKLLLFLLSVYMVTSCAPEKPRREVQLYQQYCASCHIAPKIEELPKDIWEKSVLPDMLSRMDLEEMYNDPSEVQTGYRPKIKLQDWVALSAYIVALAPEKLAVNPTVDTQILSLFDPKEMALDAQNGALITYLEYFEDENKLYYGDITGKLGTYDFVNSGHSTMYQGSTPVTWFNKTGNSQLITEVGILDPSDLERGKVVAKEKDKVKTLDSTLHRPVHTLYSDLNKDGRTEAVISEFGDATGGLSLLVKKGDAEFKKRVLLNQPGCIRTLERDMNNDGRMDLIALTSQGNESITILYQTADLKFRAEKVLEFSPIYGSSWFELVDYNDDGFMDIVTVNGDNADKSYVHKPYHGMRIHLNNGSNQFTETYFYPLNGATRVLARDFDQDGDIDFALISTFPDYDNASEMAFVYLENRVAKTYEFTSKVLKDPSAGRWFLMDAADIDADGDDDIILSSFTYVFTPVPDALAERWAQNNVDILVLENKLK